MKLTITSLVLGGAATLLIWAGVTDRNPVHVMRAILTGAEIPERGSWSGEGSGDDSDTEGAGATPPASAPPPGFVEV